MSPLEQVKSGIRHEIRECEENFYPEAAENYRAQLAAIESLEADLESTRRALEKEVAMSELATNEAKEWQSRALKAEGMAEFIDRQQLAPSIEREKQLETQVAKLREALDTSRKLRGELRNKHDVAQEAIARAEKAEAELAALEAELAATKRDTERLDWLCRNVSYPHNVSHERIGLSIPECVIPNGGITLSPKEDRITIRAAQVLAETGGTDHV